MSPLIFAMVDVVLKAKYLDAPAMSLDEWQGRAELSWWWRSTW